ncbi:hypothetical protein OXX80_001579 [Metschnikowia pulcherrima]
MSVRARNPVTPQYPADQVHGVAALREMFENNCAEVVAAAESPLSIINAYNDSDSVSSIDISSVTCDLPTPNRRHSFAGFDEEKLSPAMLPSERAQAASLQAHDDLQTVIDKKEAELAAVQQSTWELEASLGKQDVDNSVLEARISQMKRQMDAITDDTETLRKCQFDSMNALHIVLESRRHAFDLQFELNLVRVKEELSKEIEATVAEMNARDAAAKNALAGEVSATSDNIAASNEETCRTVVRFKEEHDEEVAVLQETAQKRVVAVRQRAVSLRDQIEHKKAQNSGLRSILKTSVKKTSVQLEKTSEALTRKYAAKKQQREAAVKQQQELEHKIEQIRASIALSEAAVAENDEMRLARQQAQAGLESERRLLHNKLQELKGNFRVFCRVRPAAKASDPVIPMNISSDDDLTVEGKQVITLEPMAVPYDYSTGAKRAAAHRFEFDKIFPQTSDNQEIFLEISQLVQSCLDGYNVCVFAYGQTGSGKTWTMSHENDGMIPASINKIFEDIDTLAAQGWTYTVDGQFVEIYNEQINDLLAVGKKVVKHEIKHDDAERKTTITNCTSVRLESRAQAAEVLERATRKRFTASTMSNLRSSRSHCAFILNIRGHNQVTDATCEGTLNLIDLAGSERLNSSQAKGDRLRETQAINKSLSCLGDVIHSLYKRQNSSKEVNAAHVPYRNSKLTYLLKHSLGGDAKTLMFANVSSLVPNAHETINSLRFASKVNETRMK